MESGIGEILTKLLTLKFTYQDDELIKQIESMSEKLGKIEPEKYKEFLKSYPEPHVSKLKKRDVNTTGVTIYLPFENKEDVCLSMLKSAACFPWELDPPNSNDFISNLTMVHVQKQLAYSSYYGNPKAKRNLRSAANSCPQLIKYNNKHPLLIFKKFLDSDFQTFRLPITLEKKTLANLRTSKRLYYVSMTPQQCKDNFDKLEEIEREGPKLEQEDQKKSNGLQEERTILLFVGQSIKSIENSPIFQKFLSMIEKMLKSDDQYLLKCKIGSKNIEFGYANDVPKKEEAIFNGYIFTEPMEDPEKSAKKVISKIQASFLFYNTPNPSIVHPYLNCYYLSQADLHKPYGYKFLYDFITNL